MSHHILLVEDDHSLAQITSINLKQLDVVVSHCDNGDEAWQLLASRHYDLVILDILLPGKKGTDLCRDLRILKPQQRIIMLTSLSSEVDTVLALELGADDYISKPYRVRELLARVKAQLRRIEPDSLKPSRPVLRVGELLIDVEYHQATLDNKALKLTAKEFKLLCCLASQPGKVFNKEQLLSHVWGYDFDGYEHTVNTHINRLRNKLKPFDYVQTIWGVGYKLHNNIESYLC